jgi:hypothetical protein
MLRAIDIFSPDPAAALSDFEKKTPADEDNVEPVGEFRVIRLDEGRLQDRDRVAAPPDRRGGAGNSGL